jgi:hypothetical protein
VDEAVKMLARFTEPGQTTGDYNKKRGWKSRRKNYISTCITVRRCLARDLAKYRRALS